MNQISDVQKIVLNLTAAYLFDCEIKLPESVDWEAVFKEAKEQSVVPIVFCVAEPFMDDKTVKSWKGFVITKVANNILIQCEHVELHDMLDSNKIPHVTLKGFASALYYPDHMQRVMGDVDFLVYEEDFKRTGLILENHGFKPSHKDDGNVMHVSYLRENVPDDLSINTKNSGYLANVSIWEMHRRINGMPSGSIGVKVEKYMSDVIKTAEKYESDYGTFMIPDKFHHGLILLLHTASHLTSEGIGLRHLCDWAVFAASLSDDEFTALFEQKLKSIGMWRFAQLLTACSVKYLNCPERSWALVGDDELLENILTDILNGGNFGQKDDDRTRQIKYISNRGKGTVDDKGAIRQALSAINQKAKLELGFVKKAPILAPIGWIVIGVRYIKMLVSGQRKPDSKKTIQSAGQRKEIYKQFDLFEENK